MKRSLYRNINTVGEGINAEVNNPITYCLGSTMDQKFMHGNSTYGQSSKMCQLFNAEYCSQHWDQYCELASLNENKTFPNNASNSYIGNYTYDLKGLTQGDMLVRNTAAKKYLVALGNGTIKYQPFDYTVANSPMISSWQSTNGTANFVPVYAVNPAIIDKDVVMDKLLQKPKIALDILINIHNNHKNFLGPKYSLHQTKLGKFYQSNPEIFN